MNVAFIIACLILTNCNDSLKVKNDLKKIVIYNETYSSTINKNKFFTYKTPIIKDDFVLILKTIPQLEPNESPFILSLIFMDIDCKLKEVNFSNFNSENLKISDFKIKIEDHLFYVINSNGKVIDSTRIEANLISEILNKYFKVLKN